MKDKDIYFLTNQSDAVISFNASFRVKGMQPELWDAVTGSTRALPQYSETKSYTSVPLKFEPAESGFIVFYEILQILMVVDNFKILKNLIF